jgi:glycosyltransferase involved in cell wall biosynthesis
MKIGIYNSSLDNLAVGDLSVAVLADALARSHQTEIVSTAGSTKRDELAIYCGKSLEQVSFRTIEQSPQVITDPNSPDRRYQALRDWSDDLCRPYDLFINFADRLPIYCAAQRGVLAVQFPHSFMPLTYRWLWRKHLESYQVKLVNSYYTQFWTRFLWEIDCEIVYPPVPPRAPVVKKENLIVCAGSFNATRPHNMLELVSAYEKLKTELPNWTFIMLGDLDLNAASRKHFETVRDAASECDVAVVANPTFDEQTELFDRASLFWQAAGHGEDLCRQPEKADAINLNVIRALAAGCVPLVTNSGGLPEVILTEANGFFWNDPEELIQQTLRLAKDETRRARLAKASRKAVGKFLPQRFADDFLRHLGSSFGIKPRRRPGPIWFWRRLGNSARLRI